MMATFTVVNYSPMAVKDIVIRCDCFSAGETHLGCAAQTICETVPAFTSRELMDVNMGFVDTRTARAACRILSVDVNP